MIIDRSFVDRDTGERWVIGYNNSQPGPGEPLEVFTSRESSVYRPQLQAYRDALRVLGEQPLRCALYFTALGYLHPLAELDLPAR